MFRMTRLASAIAAASLTAIPAYAQTNNELEPVIVTATRTAQTADQTIAPVTVITEADIQKSGANSMFELLQGQPGVTMTSSGGYGKPSSLFLRGTESNHVLLLIDGLKVGSATTGGAAWEHLPLDQIERIEIVRGPRSTLYGSQAIGGVIQIFTRKGTDTPQSATSLNAGSHGLRKLNANTRGKQDALSYAFSVSHFETDGWSSVKPGDSYYDADNDPYENNALTANLAYHINNSNQINANWLYSKGKNSFDTSYANASNDAVQQTIGIDWISNPNTDWESTVKIGYSEDLLENSNATEHNTRRNIASWTNHITLNEEQVLSLGIDHIDDKVSSTTNYSQTSRYENGLFGQWQTLLGRNRLVLGGRHIDNEQFGTHFNYDLEAARDLSSGLTVTAAIGEGFSAPTFADLYYPTYGNANLKPEESKSYELGIRGKHATGSWSAQIYRTDIDGLIAYSGGTYANIDKSRIDGAELETTHVFMDWNVNSSITYVDARNRITGEKLLSRPEWSFKVNANRDFGRLNAGVTWKGQTDSMTYAPSGWSAEKTNGFGTLDLAIQYEIANKTSAFFNATNILDKEYELVKNYNSPDRQISIGVNARF